MQQHFKLLFFILTKLFQQTANTYLFLTLYPVNLIKQENKMAQSFKPFFQISWSTKILRNSAQFSLRYVYPQGKVIPKRRTASSEYAKQTRRKLVKYN